MKNRIQQIRNLIKSKKARQKEGLFVVEGPHLVSEAGKNIEFVVYSQKSPIVDELMGRGIDCLLISKKNFAQLSQVETPQGILAVVRQPEYKLEDILKLKDGLILVCIGVQDPNNLGTMIRTADAVGAAGVILSSGTVDVYNPKVIRGSMGSLFHLPIVQADDIERVCNQLKEKNIQLIATDATAKENIYGVDFKKGAAILMGNEAAGLPDKLFKLVDRKVKIPMPGRADSLNVAVSASIVMYEGLRQRL